MSGEEEDKGDVVSETPREGESGQSGPLMLRSSAGCDSGQKQVIYL